MLPRPRKEKDRKSPLWATAVLFLLGGVMRIVWHESGFQGIRNECENWLEDLADRVLNTARATAPVETGFMAGAIYKEVSYPTAYIISPAPYTLYQERGTAPHIMDNGPYNWPGADHPVDVIHHPGNPATHFMENALMSAGG